MKVRPTVYFGLSTALAAFMLLGWLSSGLAAEPVRIASKKFTESVILGELMGHLAAETGAEVTHQAQLGGTRIVWSALVEGEIDAYPEYTGTLRRELLAGVDTGTAEALQAALAERGLVLMEPLGFNNTYAMAMRAERAKALGVSRLSQLRELPELVFGFGNEFLGREDGWPGLQAHYQLPQTSVSGLDHDLAYRGVTGGTLDLVDAYSTDAAIEQFGLVVLADDLGFFPTYEAAILTRRDFVEERPEVFAAWKRLEGGIDAPTMRRLNARASLDRVPEAQVAADFASEAFDLVVEVKVDTLGMRLLRATAEHAFLVGVSLGLAILFAIPLGIAAARIRWFETPVLSAVGVLQTIPSLALLVLMIPLLGIGDLPAMAALFAYSLLPIVRSTHQGIRDISPLLQDSARAIGLSDRDRLIEVELPLALPAILSGVKTSAVINVGTATLGALIGAGGYGQAILSGIRLDDSALLAEGAVPAAIMALVVERGFTWLEWYVVSPGLTGRPVSPP